MYYQETVWWYSFARQLVLYTDSEVKHKYDINRSFKKLTGIDIELFLQLMFATWMYVEQNKLMNYEYSGFLEEGYYEIIVALAGEKNAQKFIALLSITEQNAKQAIENESKIRDYDLQVFEVSVFTKKPIIHLFGHSFIPHKSILNQTVNHFIYDFMKQNDPSFTEELGRRMEKYMELGLKDVNIKYETETDLKKKYGRAENVIDFILQDEILVEAKAIELKQYTNINPVSQLLSNELKSSIVKGYAKQLLTMANKLTNKEYFGLIITYKRIYLGGPEDVWNLFLKEAVTEIALEMDLDISRLPYQNLFILDIDTWDKLLQASKNRGAKISNILKKARKNNESAETKKFYFDLHLEEYHVNNYSLKHLTKAYDKFKSFEQSNDT
ncbi:MAG: hypothetical protein R8N23_15635 [Reichenbachiella sp.]|uniref:hypothetical protein n=1 Tax=Reichenbachiella sp. TaxID=2184521 RepID=UPI0029672F4B|nr:hypothetical protein [Reichenbachiella sp.]MDW3211307.1 hypothetical protein [Reichenbachiella sp.]